MSEAKYVFPDQERGIQGLPVERRFITPAPRRGPGIGSRVVEVVQVKRGASKPSQDRALPSSSVRAEIWPEGFRAKSPPPSPPMDVQPIATEPPQPVAHVMDMWQPSSPMSTKPNPAKV